MKKDLLKFALVVSSLAFVSCSSGSGGSTCDPMRDALCNVNNNSDSSVNGNRDATTNNNRDSSTNNNRPDGTVNNQPDATVNQPDATVNQPDATVNQPDAGACGQIDPPPTGPAPCTAQTVACIDACEDSACVGNCLSQTAGCADCVDEVSLFCPARNGCETQTEDFLCCLEVDCAGAQDISACIDAMCTTQANAYEACADTNAVNNACLNIFSPEYAVCFPETPDAGVPDAMTDAGVRECAQPLDPVPDNVHTFCEAGTRTCIANAQTNQEVDNCIAADNATPFMSGNRALDCDWCIGYTQNSCGSNNGCGTEFGNFACCIEDNACTEQSCVTANCSTEVNAVNTCFAGVAATCGNINSATFDPCF